MGGFIRSATQYCTFEKRWDADGKVFMQAQAHGSLVAKTCYQIVANEFGRITKAVADETTYCYIGAPLAAALIADIVWLQIGGYIAAMTCTSDTFGIGQAIKKYNATIVCTDADFDGSASEFAVSAETDAVAATNVNAMLVPELILGTT